MVGLSAIGGGADCALELNLGISHTVLRPTNDKRSWGVSCFRFFSVEMSRRSSIFVFIWLCEI